MSEELSVTEVDTEEGFRELRDDWNRLIDHDPGATFFQTWEFQFHTWRIYSERVTPCVLVVRRRDGALTACAPLGSERRRVGPLTVRALQFASIRHCDYSSFILHRDYAEASLNRLADWMRRNVSRWHVVRLRPVREDSPLVRVRLFLDKLELPYRIEEVSVAPYLRLQGEWESYEDALSGEHRRSMRYRCRRLFRRFDGGFETMERGESLDRAFTAMMDLHQRRMEQMNQPGHFATQQARDEFRTLMLALGERGLAKVHTVESTERTIAALCTFEFRGTVSFFQGGFDPDFQKLSPGSVIHALRIDQALRDGAKEYDFLDGAEEYKFVWTNESRRLYEIEVRTGSWRRMPYDLWLGTRRRLSRSERVRWLYLRLRRNRGSQGR